MPYTQFSCCSFGCTLCEKTFGSKVKLKLHMVRHSESRDFACSECGKQFKRKDKLREHLKKVHCASRREAGGGMEPTPPPAGAPETVDAPAAAAPAAAAVPSPGPKFVPKVN